MPTGYTNMIDENPEITTKQWVMEGLARAFGVCAILRDGPFNLSEKQIIKRLRENDSNNYHQEELAKAKIDAKSIEIRSEHVWKALWKKSEAEKKKANQQSILEANKLKERHEKIRADLEILRDSSEASEVTKKIAEYGINQLHITESDCEAYIIESLSLEEYKAKILKSNKWNLEYHAKEQVKSEHRTKERLETYLQLRKDLDMLL